MRLNVNRYDLEKLKKYVEEILVFSGVKNEQAGPMVDCLVMADACGIHTHGLSVLSSHIERIKRGGYNLEKGPKVIKSFPAFTVVDAHNSIGFYSAYKSMAIAIEKSKIEGVHILFARNCNTYGAAFYFTKMAVDQGLIGITFCNSPATMPVYGGVDKLLGSNPFAMGIPCLTRLPILFDMATSVVAKSKINEARKNGESIPLGWALDINGEDTTDPIEAIKGIVLPMAGAKGAGISMMIDVLAGMLSGAAYLDEVNKFYSEGNSAMNVGQVFVSIDPHIVFDDRFYHMVDDYIDKVHASRTADGTKVRLPGEKKLHKLKTSAAEGVELTEYTVDALEKLGIQYGIQNKLMDAAVCGGSS